MCLFLVCIVCKTQNIGIRAHESNDGTIKSSICVFNIHGDVFMDEYIMEGNNGYNGLIIL